MGVYIKGMEMPRGCYDCTLESICGRWAKHDAEWQKTNRDEDCPLAHVPPHGRLIDADALHYSRIRIAHPSGDIGGYNAVVMSAEIKGAPTIIPADHIGDANEMVKAEEDKT